MHTNIESNTLTKKSPHLIALIVARSEVIDINIPLFRPAS